MCGPERAKFILITEHDMKPSLVIGLFSLSLLPGTLTLAAEGSAATAEKREPPPPLVVVRTASDLAGAGDTHLQAGRLTQAINSYRAALALSPSLHDIRLRLAQTLAKAGRPAESALEYERLNRERPNPAILLALVEARRDAGALADAAMLGKKGLEADPLNEPLALTQADILTRLRDPEGALAALKSVKSSPQADSLRAQALEAAGRWGSAYTAYKSLEARNPSPGNKENLRRAASHAARLPGLLVFAPKGWMPVPDSAALRETSTGTQTTIERHPSPSPAGTAQAAVRAHIPESLREGLSPEIQSALAEKLQEHKSGAAGHHQDVSPEELDKETAPLNSPAVTISSETLAGGAAFACSHPGKSAVGLSLPPPTCALAPAGQPLAFVLTGAEPEAARAMLLPLATIEIIGE
jgi:tetratricopeptide (TPR) repeat protein